ncbi:MAG TPA: nuclear transport factor 2 family protein [Solimonas sp.]|nr:nuclear transport factor 2 family protein [Solimonas sp.]
MDPHRAIERLLYRYAELIDAGDFAAVGQLFARGQIVAAGGVVVQGAAAVQAMYENYTRRYDCGTPRTQHLMSNVCIDLDADGRGANATLRFTVFQALEDFPLQAIIAGRYQDRYARDAEGWYFTERQMQPELVGDLSRHLLLPIPK